MTIKHLFPKAKPALNLDFANVKELDRRITFTRASTGTYVGNDGLIKTAAANEARFDHDPATGESLGLLVEESRTNYSPNSSTPTGVVNGVRTVVSGYLLPDGTTGNCTQLYVNRVQNNLYDSCLGIPPDSRFHFSFWVKNISGFSVTFVYGRTGYLSSATIPDDGKWHRLSRDVGFSNSSGQLHNLTYVDTRPAGSTNPVSNPFTLLLWGSQAEIGSFPTSYIPTSGSTVTRSADVASLTNSSIYDTDSFTILNEPFGSAAGASTLSLVGAGGTPIKRTAVYNQELTQTQINASVGKTDEFWRWRILGDSFGLPSFSTDGQVTVDWGDGTVETLTTSDHTFTDGGGYHEIGFRLDSGTYFSFGLSGNSAHRNKVVAIGPAPASMGINASNAFYFGANIECIDGTVRLTNASNDADSFMRSCSNLKSVPFIDTSRIDSLGFAWYSCTSLTSFPLIDTSSVTNFQHTWENCSGLTSFPWINTASGDTFTQTWSGCSSLTSFPSIDISSATLTARTWRLCSRLTNFPLLDFSNSTNFEQCWNGCSSLTSFPLIDASSGTNFNNAWQNCSNLTSFPAIDASSGATFSQTWRGCTSLTSFPLVDMSSGTSFEAAWYDCTSLTSFPANFFDSWTGTPSNNCFNNAWVNCNSLTATSVENILNSIDTSGQSAPASGVDITIKYSAATGTPSIATAVANLKARGWTITLNGVAQ